MLLSSASEFKCHCRCRDFHKLKALILEDAFFFFFISWKWVQHLPQFPGSIRDGRHLLWRTRVRPLRPAAPHCWQPFLGTTTSRSVVSAGGPGSLISNLPTTLHLLILLLTGKLLTSTHIQPIQLMAKHTASPLLQGVL